MSDARCPVTFCGKAIRGTVSPDWGICPEHGMVKILRYEYERRDPEPGEKAHARRTDPSTSHEAAAKVDTTKREKQVLEAMRDLKTATSKEVAEHAGVDKWSISPRMKPLEEKGLIRRTEERRDGQIVWALEEQR